MSGIAAFVRASAAGDRAQSGAALEAMMRPIAHRGRDAELVWYDEHSAVAQLLFATTPEDAACAIEGPRSPLRVTADARVDNREELIAALGMDRSTSDQELLLSAYARWGEDCPRRVLGDFAFVVVNPMDRTLFAARDPMGARPLYYHTRQDRLYVASEPAALPVPRRPDLIGVALFIAGEYTEHRHTLWEGVSALPPGHALSYRNGAMRITRFWRPDPWRRLLDRSSEDFAALVRETLETAVAARLRSVRPLAIAVSGGIDSAAVLGAMESQRANSIGPQEAPLALHIHHPDHGESEVRHSRGLVARCRVPYRELSGAVRHWTETAADPHDDDIPYDARGDGWARLFATLHEAGIRTFLTGDGVDLYVRRSAAEVVDAFRAGRLVDALMRSGLASSPLSVALWKRTLGDLGRTFAPPWLRALGRGRRAERAHPLLTHQFADCLRADLETRRARAHDREWPNDVMRDLCVVLEESYYHGALAVQDRILSRAGVDIRCPWHDRRLLELLLALPHSERSARSPSAPLKPVVRRAAQPWVPESIVLRTDTPHVGDGIRRAVFGSQPEALVELLGEGRLVAARVIRPDVAQHLPRLERLSTLTAMNLVAMELWLRQFSN